MTRRSYCVLIAFLLVGLSGCGTTPPESNVDAFVQAQRAGAEAAEAQGDLATALTYWRSLAVLTPEDPEVDRRIRELNTKIDERVALALSRGNAAYKRGDRRAGDASMMQALALRPGLEEALAPLRRSVSEVSHNRQAEKVAAEYPEPEEVEDEQEQEQEAMAVLERLFEAGEYESVLTLGESESFDDRRAVRDFTLRAHVALADRARDEGKRDRELRHIGAAVALSDGEEATLLDRERQLRKSLSEEAYRRGLGIMQSDLPQAIAQLERAVAYDPQNLAAREKLEQARKLKANLERIRER